MIGERAIYRVPGAPIGIAAGTNCFTYLIGILAYCSVMREVELLFACACAGLFVLSAYRAFSGKPGLSRWVLNILSFCVILFAAYRFNVDDLVVQMVEALMALLCIKFLEERKVRDYMQIYVISLLMVTGSGLLSPGILFLVNFSLLILLLTTASVLLSYYAHDPTLELPRRIIGKIVRNSLFIPVLAVPVAALLFFVLPRTSYPLFNLLTQKERAHTGFSDHVRLGAVSSIQEDSAAAFRATMRPVGQNNLYWRGIVFDQFDGKGWSSSGRPVPLPSGVPEGESVIQTIYLEPRETRYLIALDKPDFVAMKNAKQVDDGSFVSPASLSGRTRYMARSIVSESFSEGGTDMSRYLQVPDNISGPVLRLAKRLGDGKTDMERIRSVYRYLNDGTFRYSLENLPVTEEPVSTFLFQTKYGNCEYFASSYAIILRLLDIPSRIVGGYKGGQYNSMGGYYLVPEKNAHVWVEAHLKGKGWLRIDPTPAGIGQFSSSEKEHLFMRAGLFFDTLNYYWYAFVINYNLEKQLSLARAMRGAFRISRTTVAPVIEWKKWAKYTGFILFGCVACVFVRNARLRQRSREERLLIAFLRKMERSGYHKKESQGLEEFVSTIGDRRVGQLASEFVKEFEAFYFRDLPVSPKEAKHLNRRIKSI